jgi:predicted DNA binding CopG/RHH family protein
MLEELRILANKNDVPYQSLIKMILRERLERKRKAARL